MTSAAAADDLPLDPSRPTTETDGGAGRPGAGDATGLTGSGTGSPGRPGALQSVDRALTVLELLARHDELGVGELAAEIGVHKSTVSRLVSLLQQRGYVEQSGPRGRLRLALGMTRLAGAAAAGHDLAAAGREVGQELAHELGETVNLAVLDGDRAVNITRADGRTAIALRTWVGQVCPAHATSSGKALLSGLPDVALAVRLPPRLERFTAATVTDPARLLAELAGVRRDGWAEVCDELEDGLSAVAAPVRDHTGAVVAALSVSGPSFRFDAETRSRHVEQVVAAARRVSRDLGWVESSPG